MTNAMPTINLDTVENLTKEERALVQQILKANGTLYSSKPKKAQGDAQYLWRMVAFGISPIQQHHCMPVMADFDIEVDKSSSDRFDTMRSKAKVLDELAHRIEKSLPIAERHGTMAWGRALGYF